MGHFVDILTRSEIGKDSIFKFSSLFVLLMRLSELLLLPDLAMFPCENFNKTDDNFSSCLCRKNSDGFTFESNEPDVTFSLLLIGVDVVPAELIVLVVIDGDVFCAVPVFDGDGGVSVIDTGESANGPTRRIIFGGGLSKRNENKYR